ncbi:hypothetical protein RvY_19391 [Ramazzottius varieornatus]|uniref:Uncharacterized protein n=1 Tax=Ramazzottius varieornatus TaxID=947166 RepID=A0A1D1W988_RAMVA|nr:hypothetical protein RvY_19391 [Ramazzottius varieornatus]
MFKDFSDRSAVELAALMTNNSPQMECQICLAFLLDIQLYPGVPNLPTDTETTRSYAGSWLLMGDVEISSTEAASACRIVRNINLCPPVVQGTVDAMDIWTSAATALTGQLTLLHSGLEATRAQYAAVTAEREVQRQNRRLLREVAALRRGTPYPVEQPPTSDASTSTEASVYANASTSTKQVVMVSSSTSTDGVSGFLLRKALLSCLFRQGVEHLLGIIPVGLGRRRLLCSFLESFHLLEELDELVWNRAE